MSFFSSWTQRFGFTSLGLAVVLMASEAQAATKVPHIAGLDLNGRFVESRRVDEPVLILFFTGTGCPVVRQNLPKLKEVRKAFGAQKVQVVLVHASMDEDAETVRSELQKLGAGHMPTLLDSKMAIATGFGVDRTAEVIAIDTKNNELIYRGAIDDQSTETGQKPQPTVTALKDALTDFFDGKPVTTASLPVRGCRIGFDKSISGGTPSYSKDIAPILQNRCLTCHSEGNIGPFNMSSHASVRNKARMIEESIMSRQMPPWHADPHHGQFANDSGLSVAETQMVLKWVHDGALRGEGEDPLVAAHTQAVAANKIAWPMGEPDLVLRVPEPQKIPATGVLDYRHFKIPSNLTNDQWLGAIVVRPGNNAVVHHAILRAKYDDSGDDGSNRGRFLTGWAPGATLGKFRDGTGRFLGKNAMLDLEMHYTTAGSEQTDQTEIGLYFLKERPEREVVVEGVYNLEFEVPPKEVNSRTFGTMAIKEETVLYTLSPHMHLRGSWMKYEALYPTGQRELLLSVSQYDFRWQRTYTLKEPKTLPAGTWLLVTGGFDNSAKNPNNPDPNQRVTWGEQSWNEMFIGFMEVSRGKGAVANVAPQENAFK